MELKSMPEIYLDFLFPLADDTPEIVREMANPNFYNNGMKPSMITEYKYGGKRGYVPKLHSYTGDSTTDISGVYDFKGKPHTVNDFFGSEDNFQKARESARVVYCDPYALEGTDFDEQWKEDCGWYGTLEENGYDRDGKLKGGDEDGEPEGKAEGEAGQ